MWPGAFPQEEADLVDLSSCMRTGPATTLPVLLSEHCLFCRMPVFSAPALGGTRSLLAEVNELAGIRLQFFGGYGIS